ncbi:MAG TPA: LysR family transcriptional regulator [Deltaproteobacteria bacterium]|nr:LysR family transcriptional regulator [Deltaproteobacteria bacterium]
MNFNQLRIFYESAKLLNFSKAANHLSISQPAVSSQIKQLEEILKIKLFNKIGKKIHLTETGKILFNYADKIFTLESEAEKAVLEFKNLEQGVLHIGTTKTYARYLMPHYISKFHTLYPGVRIKLSEGSSLEMIHSLFSLKNELAIVATTNYPKSLNTILFRKEKVILVSSPEHMLGKKGSITIEELSKVPLIVREEGSGVRKIVNDLFKNRNLSPTILYEASNFECIKELVIRGEGASFVVKLVVEKEIADGILKEIAIDGENLTMEVMIRYLSEKNLSRAALEFINIFLKKNNNIME